MVLTAPKLDAIDSIIRVVTPENIAFEYRVAGPFRRLPAYLLDVAIKWAVLLTILLILSLTVGLLSPALVMAIMILASFVSGWFYGGLFETYWNGQTPGKRILGLRVLRDDGQPIDAMQAVMRNILRDADILMGIVGLGVTMSNSRFQRLGDLVCGTIVVTEQRQWLMGVAKLDDPRAIQLAAYLPPNFIVPRPMARALATYVERRRFFSVPRRREVARHLAEPLLAQFGLPADTSYDLLLCALYYRTFIADRKEDERRLAEATAAIATQAPFAGFGLAAPAPYVAPPLPQTTMVGIPDSRR